MNVDTSFFFSGVKTRLMWSPPTTSLYIRELAYDESKKKIQSCLFANRLSFSENIRCYFTYVEREKIMCGRG